MGGWGAEGGGRGENRDRESGGLLRSNALRIVSTDEWVCFINTLIITSIRRDERWRVLQLPGEIKAVVMW